jgi:glycine/D-amino acid oxidase-like deaminating enzyme
VTRDRYDVVVVGSGSAGSAAAITSAWLGARTLLVDRLAFMGGTSTAVLDTFYAFYTPGEAPRRVVGGLGWEVVERLIELGVAFERPNTYGAGTGVTYDQETLKVLWEELAEEAGVELLLHTWATGTRVEDGRLVAIRTWNKGGERWIEAGAVVDASGDADVAALARAAYDNAAKQGSVQSLSTLFKLANVDVERATAVKKAELWERMREAAASGAYRLPRVEGSWHRTPFDGVVLVHMTRVPNVDATDPEQLTRAELDGRRQVREYARFLRDRVPGFERSVVVATSPAIGVRESRRVIGDYRLTRDDVLEARRFDDEIARRCFSATHDAHASARSMATCMAMGQAAGTAARIATRSGIMPRDVDATSVRTQLLEDGALLDPLPTAVAAS